MGLWLNGRLINTDTVDFEGKVEIEDWRLRDEAGCITRYTSLLSDRRLASSFKLHGSQSYRIIVYPKIVQRAPCPLPNYPSRSSNRTSIYTTLSASYRPLHSKGKYDI